MSHAEKFRVRDVACGYGFTVFATDSSKDGGHILGTGVNVDGQLGER